MWRRYRGWGYRARRRRIPRVRYGWHRDRRTVVRAGSAPLPPVRRQRGSAGAFGDGDMGEVRNAVGVNPGVESGNRVHPQDQTQRHAGEFLAQRLQRVRGHGRSGARELPGVRLESGDVGKRGFEQAHAHFGTRLGGIPESWTGRRHQAYRVETQGGAHLQGEPDVSAVHRIERSAQNPDCFEGCRTARWHGVSKPLKGSPQAPCHAKEPPAGTPPRRRAARLRCA